MMGFKSCTATFPEEMDGDAILENCFNLPRSSTLNCKDANTFSPFFDRASRSKTNWSLGCLKWEMVG